LTDNKTNENENYNQWRIPPNTPDNRISRLQNLDDEPRQAVNSQGQPLNKIDEAVLKAVEPEPTQDWLYDQKGIAPFADTGERTRIDPTAASTVFKILSKNRPPNNTVFFDVGCSKFIQASPSGAGFIDGQGGRHYVGNLETGGRCRIIKLSAKEAVSLLQNPRLNKLVAQINMAAREIHRNLAITESKKSLTQKAEQLELRHLAEYQAARAAASC
jgi:hypothetical protein